MTALSDYLSGLEAVEAKATNGEWKNVGVHVFNKRTRAIVACYPDATSARANAALIATARNNLKKLIAIVRAFEKDFESAPHDCLAGFRSDAQ